MFDLNNNLVLNLFLILNIGDETGPRISTFLRISNFFFILWASNKLSASYLEEIINAINLENGGKFFFFLR